MGLRELALAGALAGLLGACADGTTDRRTVKVDGIGVLDVWALESPPGIYDLQIFGPTLERFNLMEQQKAVETAVATYMDGRCPAPRSEQPKQNVRIYSVTVVCR